MRTFILAISLLAIIIAAHQSAWSADSFPAMPAPAVSYDISGRHPSSQERVFYGYVPPPPILHSWPGGYRVLVHEIMNTLMDHIIGRY